MKGGRIQDERKDIKKRLFYLINTGFLELKVEGFGMKKFLMEEKIIDKVSTYRLKRI